MTNSEIQVKIDEILDLENICDVVIALQNFEKEYRGSDFYKQSKMSLKDLIMFRKQLRPIDINKIFKQIQVEINNLDLSNIEAIIDQFTGVFEGERGELMKELDKILPFIK